MLQTTHAEPRNWVTASNWLARLVWPQQLLKRYPEHEVALIWFTAEKIFTVAALSNSHNDRDYAVRDTLKKQIAAKWNDFFEH